MPVEQQVAVIFAGVNGFLDTVEVEKIRQWEDDYLKFMLEKHTDILTAIKTAGKIEDDTKVKLETAVNEFKAGKK